MANKLLVLDDDPEILDMLKHLFAGEAWDLSLETETEAALRKVLVDRPNVALLDINLPGRSGLDILQEVKKIDPKLPVIMMSGYKTTKNAIEAMKLGAFDYVTKPFDNRKLKEAVAKAYEANLLNRKVRYSARPAAEDEIETEDVMIGSSPEMVEIWKMVGSVAYSDATILIQGESGTGKELLARAIYNNSKRKNRPFLAINCAALPDNLLESELFGHEKGAFTDAHSRRIGKFEQCNGGTIFLDEIGEMSLASQGKILRLLENQEFERVGGNETVKVDVRIICATNRSLPLCVRDKTFRMDLFYRLRVVNFFLPPLRDRKEDLPLLIDLFIKKFAKQYGKNISGASPEAMEILCCHRYDGNIRELKNIINSAVVFCRGNMVMRTDLDTLFPGPIDGLDKGQDFSDVFAKILEPQFNALCAAHPGRVMDNINSGLEKALIEMALKKTDNNQVHASKLLGISRNTLRDRLEKYQPSAG